MQSSGTGIVVRDLGNGRRIKSTYGKPLLVYRAGHQTTLKPLGRVRAIRKQRWGMLSQYKVGFSGSISPVVCRGTGRELSVTSDSVRYSPTEQHIWRVSQPI